MKASMLLVVSTTLPLISPVPALAAPQYDYAFVVTSDYDVSGSTATVEAFDPWSVDKNLESVHSDAVARHYGGLVYVVNGLLADNIQVLDPERNFETVLQFSVGPGSNPRDIAFVSPERAYVTRYETPWLYEVNPSTGAIRDSIDLSSFADADGIPEMSHVVARGTYLYVSVQRLDRDYYWVPVPPSYLVVIDTDTNEILDVDPTSPGVQGIPLTGTNPFTEMIVDEGAGMIYVGESGHWCVDDGGIDRVDAVQMEALGFISTEAELGGDINDFSLAPGGRGYAVVSACEPEWEAYCVSFELSSGNLIGEVWRPGGFSVADIETHAGSRQLFLCDRTYTAPGVRIFDTTDDHQLTAGPLNVGLPPHDLVLMGENMVGVAEGVRTARSGVAVSCRPNPFTSGTSIEVRAIDGRPVGQVLVELYGASGRLVRRLADGRVPVGGRRIPWDGCDGQGRELSSGVYFVRASTGSGSSFARILLVK